MKGRPALARVEEAERRSAWVVAVALIRLCISVIVSVALGPYMRERPDAALVGLAVAAVAVIGMPLLARRKRQLAARHVASAGQSSRRQCRRGGRRWRRRSPSTSRSIPTSADGGLRG
jgi:hypothetical protein